MVEETGVARKTADLPQVTDKFEPRHCMKYLVSDASSMNL
jgi:hypothetical protein